MTTPKENSSKYQTEFEHFREKSTISGRDLKTKWKAEYSDETDWNHIIKVVFEKLLEEKKAPLQAKNNLDVAKRLALLETFNLPESLEYWRDENWELVAKFLSSLTLEKKEQGIFQFDARTALNKLTGDLLNKLPQQSNGEIQFSFDKKTSFPSSSTNALTKQNISIFKEFIRPYTLKDKDDDSEVKSGPHIKEFLRANCERIFSEIEKHSSSGDEHITIRTALIHRFKITEDEAIEILMRGAPESLWEIKCIQAGISNFVWKEKGSE